MFVLSTRNFPPETGGIQSLMEGLAQSLLNYGPVKVFADKKSDEDYSYDNKSQLDVERVSGIKLFRKYRKSNVVNEFVNNTNNIRALFVDHWKSLEHLNLDIISKTKVFCLIHSKEINHPKNSNQNKRIVSSASKADFIIANSNFTKRLAINIGIDGNKIKVIFPGIKKPHKINDEFKLESENIFQSSFPKIITVARLEKRKGHDKILMSVKNLKNKYPRIKYVSIGDGKEKNKLHKLCEELSLKKEVCFLNNITESLKIALITNSNFFLMPTIVDGKSVEGFGISYVEAASYGIGSIGGKDGGESDAISHNKTGLICDGNDLNSIYSSIETMLENKNYLKFGKKAEEFSKNFYWDVVIKNYIGLIKSI